MAFEPSAKLKALRERYFKAAKNASPATKEYRAQLAAQLQKLEAEERSKAAKDVEPVGAKKYICITKDGVRHDIEAENAQAANAVVEKRFGYANISVPPQESLRAHDAQLDPQEDKRWKQHMHQDGLWCGDVNCKVCAKSGAMAKGVKEMKAKDEELSSLDKAFLQYRNMDKSQLSYIYKRSHKVSDLRGVSPKALVYDIMRDEFGNRRVDEWLKGSAKDVKPVKYSAEAVQKEISKDKRIGGKEAKAIHALLKGRTGDAVCPLCKYPMSGSKCDNPGCEASGNVPPVIIERRKKEAAEQAERARISKLRNASYAKDASPFDVDTDAGAARIVQREAKAGLSAEKIAKKHGFSLSFVKEVLAGKAKDEPKNRHGETKAEVEKQLKDLKTTSYGRRLTSEERKKLAYLERMLTAEYAEDVKPVGDGKSDTEQEWERKYKEAAQKDGGFQSSKYTERDKVLAAAKAAGYRYNPAWSSFYRARDAKRDVKPVGDAEFAVGDKVHLALRGKGGAGFTGTVQKIEGDSVWVRANEDFSSKYGPKVYKGLVSNLSRA